VFLDRRQWDEANRLLSKALELDPKSALARSELAQMSIARGQPQQVLDYIKPVVDANSNALDARLLFAQSLLLTDRAEDGLAELNRLVSDAPPYAAAHVLLGKVLRSRGDRDGAIEQFEAATEAQPNDPEAYVALSTLYFDDGQYGQADKVLRERAMRQVPQSPEIRNALAWVAATCPDPMYRNGASALRMAQALCEETQNQSPFYLDTLAAALAEVGKFKEAAGAQQRAIDLWKTQRQDPLPGMEERLRLYQAGQPYRASPTPAQPTTQSAEAGERE
jgi:tetratricopeptide (TPR) repeat protein